MTPPRYIFLDVMRGIAVLWMVQVHITNQILDPALRNGPFFDLLNISNGFVAPTFIFCAGAGLWIALSRKSDLFLRPTSELFQYLRRLSYILFWAYALHVPIFSLQGMLKAPGTTLISGLQFDVLHTIVFSSLLVLAIHFVTRSLRRSEIVSGVLAVAVMCGTLFFWQSGFASTFPAWIRVPFDNAISPFPFLPWCCYFLSGFVASSMFFKAENKQKFAKAMVAVGLVLPVILFTIKNTTHTPWTDHWWTTSPGMHLFRMSATILCLGTIFLFEPAALARQASARTLKFLQKIGTESLFLYVSHLLIVYGATGAFIIDALGIARVGYAGVALSWIVLLSALLPLMFIWNKSKRAYPTFARWALIIQIAWMLISFIVLPEQFNMFG